MSGFEHSSIPLTVSLRVERGNAQNERSLGFQGILEIIKSSLVDEDPKEGVFGDYEYTNLWNFRDSKTGLRFTRMPRNMKVQVLRRYTWWYKRLKSCHKKKIKDLLATRKGILHLKEILHTVDGTIISLMLSVPEAFLSCVDRGESIYALSDHIMNNLVSNLLQNYSGVQATLKKWKKGMKNCAFNKTQYNPSNKLLRNLSWLMPITQYLNSRARENSKEKMFRVCVLTQTRSVGLADKKMVNNTIREFISEVTVIKDYKPDDEVEKAISTVLDRVVLNAGGVSPHFRMSMSTSSCTESSKSKEGKFGYLKRKPNLPELPVFSVENKGGQLTPLWFEARDKILKGDPSIWKTNIAGIRENAKCRVVQAGSFYKDTFLQPFSHLTIECLKSEYMLRDSFTAGRLGYRFIESVAHTDPKRGAVIFEDKVVVLSMDWTKATDRPSVKKAHAVTVELLRRMGLDKESLEAIKLIWPGQKDLYLNGNLIGRAVNGVPMGDPLTKTDLSITHPICVQYATQIWGVHEMSAAGNGDDGVLIIGGKHPREFAEAYLHCASTMGYDLSPEDTFITEDWWTYCEEVGRIPLDRFNTVINANRLKDMRLMPYLDLPKVRLLIDTRKDREDFSSNTQGKYTLLGKDMEYVKNDTRLKNLFSVADAIQDVSLGLKYERKAPVYLPKQLFGVGKVPACWNKKGYSNAIKNLRDPFMRDFTITAMRETLNLCPPALTLLKGSVTVGQKHFEGEALLEVRRLPEGDPIRKFCQVEEDQWDLFPQGVLEKLLYGRRLVPESKILAYYLFQERLQTLEQKIEAVELFEVVKSEKIELIRSTDYVIDQTVDKFVDTFRNAPWLLNTKKRERLYPSTILAVLAKCDPLRVDLNWEFLNRFQKRTAPDSPYERAMERLTEWFEENRLQVIAGGDWHLPPTEIIEDDPIIVRQCKLTTAEFVIIITNDKKLVRLVENEVPQRIIGRISVEDWVNIDADETAVLNVFRETWPTIIPEIIVDQGALETFLLKTDVRGERYPGWQDSVTRLPPLGQEDIYDTYLPPRIINKENIWQLININVKRSANEWRSIVTR